MGHNDLGDFHYSRGDLQVPWCALWCACKCAGDPGGFYRVCTLLHIPSRHYVCTTHICRHSLYTPPPPRARMQNALRSYLRTRDYCTTPKHITGMCLHILRVANESQTYTHVHNYAHRARQAPGAGDDVVVLAQINAVLGLAHLHSSKYAEAASHFLKVIKWWGRRGKGEGGLCVCV